MRQGLDHDAQCPGCGKAVGDHLIREWTACLDKAGFNYEMPFEDIPGGPIRYPGVEGEMVGEVIVKAAVLDTGVMGKVPALQFVFVGAGAQPMERRQLMPITLVMDDVGLEAVARLVRNSVKKAVQAARKAAA